MCIAEVRSRPLPVVADEVAPLDLPTGTGWRL
jgi:hypothetical protein